MKWDDKSNLSKVSELSLNNAKEFLEEAKGFAGQLKWARACGFLIFCLEETTKSKLCGIYREDKTEEEVAKNVGRKPIGVFISKNKLNSLFDSHNSKRLTVIVQLIMESLNGLDESERKLAFKSIKKSDPNTYPKFKDILFFHKRMNDIRNKCFYIEKDASGPMNITEDDYNEILKYVEMTMARMNSFSIFRKMDGKDVTYGRLESNIQLMIDRLS